MPIWQSCLQHKNKAFLFAPSQGIQNLALLSTFSHKFGQSNPFISYKSIQINMVKHSKFVIDMTGDFMINVMLCDYCD